MTKNEKIQLKGFFDDFHISIRDNVPLKKRTKKDRDRRKIEALTRMIKMHHDVARVLGVRSDAVLEFVSEQLLLLRHV